MNVTPHPVNTSTISPNERIHLFFNIILLCGTPSANKGQVQKIKITATAIKITLCTMDLDGEEIFPFNFL